MTSFTNWATPAPVLNENQVCVVFSHLLWLLCWTNLSYPCPFWWYFFFLILRFGVFQTVALYFLSNVIIRLSQSSYHSLSMRKEKETCPATRSQSEDSMSAQSMYKCPCTCAYTHKHEMMHRVMYPHIHAATQGYQHTYGMEFCLRSSYFTPDLFVQQAVSRGTASLVWITLFSPVL